MNIVMIGPPGSGKGVQGTRLTTTMGYDHLSTGAMLRAEMTAHTEIGATVAATVAAGALVPDELIAALALPQIEAAASARGGYVLDGFPRSTAQAAALLSTSTPPQLAVVLDVPTPALVERVRRRARKAAATTPTRFSPTGSPSTPPPTRPVLDLFAPRGLVHRVDADAPPVAPHIYESEEEATNAVRDTLPRQN